MKGVLLSFLLGASILGGCSAPPKSTLIKKPKTYTVPKRCRTIGMASSSRVRVLIQKDCLKNGVTTIINAITDASNPKLATEDAVRLWVKILGFKPSVGLLVHTKNSKMPIFLFVVTGIAD